MRSRVVNGWYGHKSERHDVPDRKPRPLVCDIVAVRRLLEIPWVARRIPQDLPILAAPAKIHHA